MKRLAWTWLVCAACSSGAAAPDAGVAGADAADPCPPCLSDKDCPSGAACAQFAGDSYCAATCAAGCPGDRSCLTVNSGEGKQVDVCVPIIEVCGTTFEISPDASVPAPALCGPLVGPASQSCCRACTGKPECQPNGCYNGWFCNGETCRCQRPPDPATCAPPAPRPDAGPAPDGAVGANGGALDVLRFAIVGDTRPPSEDDTAGYPTAVIDKIWRGVESEAVPFAVATGDYMFASPRGTESAAQLDLYLAARAHFSGPVFFALGNHECTGATASNCGPGTRSGDTTNYRAFMQRMLGPIGKTTPYYSFRVDARDASWTAKFVVVAGNAWTDAQATWLEAELAVPTTYTFVIRHEPRFAETAPGVPPSEAIMARHPRTLSIVGHTHSYFFKESTKEVVVGNGGAPLSSSVDHGYAVAERRPDGAIEVSAIDYSTRAVFHRFAVMPDGTPLR